MYQHQRLRNQTKAVQYDTGKSNSILVEFVKREVCVWSLQSGSWVEGLLREQTEEVKSAATKYSSEDNPPIHKITNQCQNLVNNTTLANPESTLSNQPTLPLAPLLVLLPLPPCPSYLHLTQRLPHTSLCSSIFS